MTYQLLAVLMCISTAICIQKLL